MAVELNHTIVHARDKHATARHLTTLLGLPEHTTYGPFAVVQLDNGVSLDVADEPGTLSTTPSSCPRPSSTPSSPG